MRQQPWQAGMAVFLLGQLFASVAIGVLQVAYPEPQPTPVQDALINGLGLGVPFSQLALLIIWHVFGRPPLVRRMLLSIFGGFLVWLTAYVFLPMPKPIGFASAMLIQWCVAQIPLWPARQIGGFVFRSEPSHDSPVAKRQFGIRHLIGWMTAVGLLLGAARAIAAVDGLHELIAFSIFVAFNCLMLLAAIAVGMSRRAWLPAVTLLPVSVIVVSLAEKFAFEKLYAPGGPVGLFFSINTVQAIWIAGSLVVISKIGFRIGR